MRSLAHAVILSGSQQSFSAKKCSVTIRYGTLSWGSPANQSSLLSSPKFRLWMDFDDDCLSCGGLAQNCASVRQKQTIEEMSRLGGTGEVQQHRCYYRQWSESVAQRFATVHFPERFSICLEMQPHDSCGYTVSCKFYCRFSAPRLGLFHVKQFCLKLQIKVVSVLVALVGGWTIQAKCRFSAQPIGLRGFEFEFSDFCSESGFERLFFEPNGPVFQGLYDCVCYDF